MKTLAMVATMAITAAAGTAVARNIEFPVGPVVVVCVDNAIPGGTLNRARLIASRMFATAGVTIDWRGWSACPAGGIRVSLSQDTPESERPNTFAYALPYEGTHIVLFWDRIARSAQPEAVPFLLAHVLVHEVTHILQGVNRHSETGVMKASFETADIPRMQYHPLPFTDEDLELIHAGIIARQAR
jgi:hypothetical protein